MEIPSENFLIGRLEEAVANVVPEIGEQMENWNREENGDNIWMAWLWVGVDMDFSVKSFGFLYNFFLFDKVFWIYGNLLWILR